MAESLETVNSNLNFQVNERNVQESSSGLECAICLQQCVHPAQLPCGHIFCFLCIKGIAFQSGRCAMCRQSIPADFLFKPKLLTPINSDNLKDTYHWFYEGGSGWWQYDLRASAEIEEAYQKGEKSCNLLLAGSIYVIDFTYMVQYRQTNPVRRRKIKRDRSITDKLGVAGLTENVLKKQIEDVNEGLQQLWPVAIASSTRTVLPGAESSVPSSLSRFTRHDSENYGLESLGPDEYPDEFDYQDVSPSQRDGRCFNPRLDLGESGDEESEEEGDNDRDEEDDAPRRIMSGSNNVSSAAFRPLPLRGGAGVPGSSPTSTGTPP